MSTRTPERGRQTLAPDSEHVDERDMAVLTKPTYRAMIYTRIAGGFYGNSSARNVAARDVREALQHCDTLSKDLGREPHRIELYGVVPLDDLGQVASNAAPANKADKLGALLCAWDRGVEVTEDDCGQIVEIHSPSKRDNEPSASSWDL